jgi:ABC-type dipeptide/oligopeptide/nickel transport system permease subunit
LARPRCLGLVIATRGGADEHHYCIVYGAVAGYYGGKPDMVMMRHLRDHIDTLPQVVVVTMFIQFFGAGNTVARPRAESMRGSSWVPTAHA